MSERPLEHELDEVGEPLALERTRRERAEALLADAVRAYDEAPAMFCTLACETFSIVECNLRLSKTLGVARDELLESRLLDFLPPHERQLAARCLRTIAVGEIPEQTTFHLCTGQGPPIPVLVSGSALEPSTQRFRLVLRDVSQEHLLATRLHEAQKLELVGQLASGVAHDFNNTLQVIMGAASLLALDLAEDHPGRREVDAILDAAEVGSGLTRQLLALSRPLPERENPERDLGQMIRRCEPLIKRALGPYNALVLDLSPRELPVRLSEAELGQVLINLAINGRDAMPSQGAFTIRTRAEESRVALEIEDNGVGIAAELVEHVLEPFVTTKSASGGTGLGLAVCKRIVEGWGGTLALHSELGVGTRIAMRLPLHRGLRSRVDAHDTATAEAERGWSVLVVDDEPMVRNLVARALATAGHEVLSADGLPMALEIAGNVGHLDVVVTDVVMPTGSGVELAEALWEKHPELPVVFMSGYTGDAVHSEVLARPNVAFLAKPFVPPRLLELFETFEVGAASPR